PSAGRQRGPGAAGSRLLGQDLAACRVVASTMPPGSLGGFFFAASNAWGGRALPGNLSEGGSSIVEAAPRRRRAQPEHRGDVAARLPSGRPSGGTLPVPRSASRGHSGAPRPVGGRATVEQAPAQDPFPLQRF